MKPYSLDLRQRVLTAYLGGEGSQREIADRFKVSPDFVYRLLKQHRDTGTITPKRAQTGGGPKIDDDGLSLLAGLLAAHPDDTLAELCARYEDATGVRVSVSTMCRTRQRARDLGLERRDAAA